MRMFKYFGAERLSVIENCLIRFSPPAAFNDPFEFFPFIKSINTQDEFESTLVEYADRDHSDLYAAMDEGVKAIMSKEEFHVRMSANMRLMAPLIRHNMESSIPAMQEALYAGWNNHIGVLCLSEKNDDLLMWAHYADCHKGFVLEFDPQSDFFNRKVGPNDSLRSLRKVVYGQKRPEVTLSQTNEEEFFLTKSDHWEYEAEWRMMLPLSEADKTLDMAGEKICLFEFPVNAVKSVVLGAKMPEGLSMAVIEKLRSNNAYKNVSLFRAKIHPTDYRLIVEQID
ncbi:DUF2971 domain-containing protein [Pseudomonas koreensis]|uniref:DUF2971 domain-containing protein n=1 Tax=Pseudomonas koreensis TaxID=198620 RepID=UPI002FC6A078